MGQWTSGLRTDDRCASEAGLIDVLHCELTGGFRWSQAEN